MRADAEGFFCRFANGTFQVAVALLAKGCVYGVRIKKQIEL